MKKAEINTPAPLWKKACAYVIDVLIVSLVIILPLGNLYPQKTTTSLNEAWSLLTQELTKTHMILSLLIGVLTILYWAILEYKLSQTLGKMLMKIRVHSLTNHLTFKQCIVRNLTKVSFLLLLLDTLYIIKSGHQRFFDMLAQTEVIEHQPSFPQRKK